MNPLRDRRIPVGERLRREDEFFKDQFNTLRKEIEEAKKRVFQAMGVGLIVVPGSQLIPYIREAPLITVFLPLLVIVAALIYLSESSAIIRCGCYIRHHIEPRFRGTIGWENWLESDLDHRALDTYLSRAFQSLFGFYYVISVALGLEAAIKINNFTALLIGILYSAFGVALGFFLWHNSHVNTKIKSRD